MGHEREQLFASPGERPAVCSFTESIDRPGLTGAELVEAYAAAVRALCRWADKSGMMVGHIKLFLERGGQSLWLSSTGGELSRKTTDGWFALPGGEFTLNFTAIIYGVDESTLGAFVRGALDASL